MTSTEDLWLVVSDIDDTLTGDREALHELVERLRARRETVRVVLNSSRPAGSVAETLKTEFPAGFSPDGIITGLGTEITMGHAIVEAWAGQFADWPRQAIVDVVARFGHQAHPDIYQTPAKASFSVPDKAAVDEVLAALEARGLPLQAIYSGASDLDLIAPGAGKDEALRFVARHFGISTGRVIAAGDSGNDVAMFRAADKAIAVGNAREELLATAPQDKTYFAKARHAAGVAEGLKAFGVLEDAI